MKKAFITFSEMGVIVGKVLVEHDPGITVYLHESAPYYDKDNIRFSSVMKLAKEVFYEYKGLIFCAPTGLVVRAIAPHIKKKTTDPAVVVIDAGARYVISLLGGHEAGANHLAVEVSNILGAEPVISTTTEAVKNLIIGIGCRRGTDTEKIIESIKKALGIVNKELGQVRLLASADIKSNEMGLINAASILEIPVRFIKSSEIKAMAPLFDRSKFVEEKVKLPAVAEPAALLAGRRTRLILKKQKFQGITIVIAEESFI